jgi:flavin-dependent dehydrogenase
MLSVFSEIPTTSLEIHDQSIVHTVFGLRGFGYGWLFPKQNTLNIGIAGLLSSNTTHRMNVVYQEFLTVLQQQGILSTSLQIEKMRGGIIPIQGATTKTYRDRLLLCGDAAGLVHGITGEGIYYAMTSGALAAQALLHAFEQNNFSELALSEYERLWQQDIGQEIAESVHIQKRLIQVPSLTNTVVQTVGSHSGMQRVFTDYFMGKTPYRDLKRSLMLHFLPQYLKLQTAKLFQSLSFLKEKTIPVDKSVR